MPIVTISESLLLRSRASDGRILRDRMLSGFCVRMNARTRVFKVITTVRGQPYRVNLGYWPLMSVDEARSKAMELLRICRRGEVPERQIATPTLPTLREVYVAYCAAKKIKASSQKRYESLFRTHFGEWLDRQVTDMGSAGFAAHCQEFAGSKGAALVELGRDVVGALVRYVNAVHCLELKSPFARLAGAGLMPERAKPRVRVLQEAELPAWRAAVDQLPEKQRDFLYLTLYTGLRRNECRHLRRCDIDLVAGVLCVPETKNGKPHSLPVTPLMREILERRCLGLAGEDQLFTGVSAEHVHSMAMRLGAPRFMLHDLRKMLATVGQKQGVSDSVLRRILNHTASRSDVLNRVYVGLGVADLVGGLEVIQRGFRFKIDENHPS